MRLVIYDKAGDGHRRNYLSILSRVLDGEVLTGKAYAGFARIALSRNVILSSADHYIFTALIFSIIRCLLWRKTLLILIRPERVFYRPIWHPKSFILRAILLTFRLLPKTFTVSILPYFIEPRAESYTDGWIFDPEFWDLKGMSEETKSDGIDFAEIRKTANKRKLLIAIGSQNEIKGSNYLMNLYRSSSGLRSQYLFVLCGKFSDEITSIERKEFEDAGGICINRFITDQELLSCYQNSDLVWACYHPSYNQSSGIFGRALQFGRPVVVRENSYLHAYLSHFGEGVAIPFGDMEESSSRLVSAESCMVSREKFNPDAARDRSISTINRFFEG